MEICEKSLCTGCAACANICPHNAISMEEDFYGEIHPVIDANHCVDCHLCVSTCHIAKPLSLVAFREGYALRIRHEEALKRSSSGGAAYMLAKRIFELGGCLYSVCFNANLQPVVSKCSRLDGFTKFQGSKYVQAYTNFAYREIKQELQSELKPVLFIGTPCQVAGLKRYLRKEYPNLYCADLLCHAVVPYKYFKHEIESHVKIKDADDCVFRSNDKLNHRFTILNKNKDILYSRSFLFNKYYLGYYLGVTHRESCIGCKYASPNRIGDLTIGDLLGTFDNLHSLNDGKKNSIILVNTSKGDELVKMIDRDGIDIEAINRQQILANTPSLKAHDISGKWIAFRKYYPKYGYEVSMKKLVTPYVIRNYLKYPFERLQYKLKRLKNIFKSV